MKPFRVPAAEIEQRRRNIQNRLQADGIDGLLIVQRVDLFYFSGTSQNGLLYIPSKGEPLLCIKRYLPRARSESALQNLLGVDSITELPDRIIDFYGRLPTTLGLEYDVLTVNEFGFFAKLFSGCRLVDAAPLILAARMVKSDWEIDQMALTAEMSRKTFDYMQTALRPGLSEMEFAGLVETFARTLGHGGRLRTRHYATEAYPWHVLAGKSGGKVGLLDSPCSGEGTSAAFPCGAGPRKLKPKEPILVDFGSVLNGYHIDETRMFAMGAMPPKAMKACTAAIDIHDAVIERCQPGLSTGELFEFAVTTATKMGVAESFLGPPGLKVPFVGHGIGLELVEPPFIARGKTDLLEAGMTFALEPKFCFQDEFAAGVESVFRVTRTGCALVSKVAVQVFVCNR